MSRAVIDQVGFRVVFIGLAISLLLGLTLKAQISSQKIQALIQESTARLDKDFIVDFQSAEVILSKWGLPLPFVQISQIRLSPRKSACQNSQIYIDKLILPLSPIALLTSNTLIKEISATNVELRISDLNLCLTSESQLSEERVPVSANQALSHLESSEKQNIENIFQIKTSGLLQKLKIDQLKVIFKKYPTQPLNLKQVQLDFFYTRKKLDKVQLFSQVYALKDSQSELMFFKGELNIIMSAQSDHHIETEAKLRGHLLDGEIQVYTIYNSLEQNIKVDLDFKHVAIKPFIQLNLIESGWMNYPVAIQFHGYGQYQIDGNHMTILKFNDIYISGERTQIQIPEMSLKKERDLIDINPFVADIQNLDLNKLANFNQIKIISQSIENFGEINGTLKFKNKNDIQLEGEWSGIKFIFSNRGEREFQKIDSFHIDGQWQQDLLNLKMSQFKINDVLAAGQANISYHQKTSHVEAEAELEGPLLNEKVWQLLSQVSQKPKINLSWTYRKADEERHQINITLDEFKTNGLKLAQTDISMIQSSQIGISSSLALSAKAKSIEIDPDALKLKVLTQIFNPQAYLQEKYYLSGPLYFNLKGPDWKNMTYDFETRLKSKTVSLLKGRGEWKDDDSASGVLSIQSQGQLIRYDIIKKDNNTFEVQPL